MIKTIGLYIKDGFDVRCIPVLMSTNFDQIYDIIKLSRKLGIESVFVDRFESGGLGSKVAERLKPDIYQFKKALSQMIQGRDNFNIPVGFGTAIPFCLDERLIKEKMWADCGAGTTFCAINPDGDLRICNQSNIIYGNILRESVEQIWNKNKIDEFRKLEWVIAPCKNCVFLHYCVGGCKVDLNCSQKYCVDYAVREDRNNLVDSEKMEKLAKLFFEETEKTKNFPKKYREFEVGKYTKLNLTHKENYLVTRYQTIILDKIAVDIVKEILKGDNLEYILVDKFKNLVKERDLRNFLTDLVKAGAIKLK